MIARLNDFTQGQHTGLSPKNRPSSSLAVLKDFEIDRTVGALVRRKGFQLAFPSSAAPGTLLGPGVKTRLWNGSAWKNVAIFLKSDYTITILVEDGVTDVFYGQTAWDWSVDVYDNTHLDLFFSVAGNRIRAGNTGGYPVWFGRNNINRFRTGASTWGQSSITGSDGWLLSDEYDFYDTAQYFGASAITITYPGGGIEQGEYTYGYSLILDNYQETACDQSRSAYTVVGNNAYIQYTLHVYADIPARVNAVMIYRKKTGENIWWSLVKVDLTSATPASSITKYYASGDYDFELQPGTTYWTDHTTYFSINFVDYVSQSQMIERISTRRGFTSNSILMKYGSITQVDGRPFVVGLPESIDQQSHSIDRAQNRVYYANINGDGVIEHDVFPLENYLEFDSEVKAITEVRGDLLVLTEYSISKISFGGKATSTGLEWVVTVGEKGTGIKTPRSLSVLNGIAYWIAQDTLRSYDGNQQQLEGVAIQDVLDGLSTDSWMCPRPSRNELWLLTGQGASKRILVKKGSTWREVSPPYSSYVTSLKSLIPSLDGEVMLVFSTWGLIPTGTGQDYPTGTPVYFTPTIKTNPIDFEQPDYQKRIDSFSLVYRCDTAITLKIYLDRSGSASVTRTLAAATSWTTATQRLPLMYGKEIEIELTVVSTAETANTYCYIDEISISGEPVRRIGE